MTAVAAVPAFVVDAPTDIAPARRRPPKKKKPEPEPEPDTHRQRTTLAEDLDLDNEQEEWLMETMMQAMAHRHQLSLDEIKLLLAAHDGHLIALDILHSQHGWDESTIWILFGSDEELTAEVHKRRAAAAKALAKAAANAADMGGAA